MTFLFILDSPPANFYKAIGTTILNNRTYSYRGPNGHLPMWNKTRQILEDFYRPYNHWLACLLEDESFMW